MKPKNSEPYRFVDDGFPDAREYDNNYKQLDTVRRSSQRRARSTSEILKSSLLVAWVLNWARPTNRG